MGGLRGLKELLGYRVQAADGDLGHVREFYFDDARWGVRYLVVDRSGWFPGRLVLIAPAAWREPQWHTKIIPVALTKQQVQTAPSVDTEQPLARADQLRLHRHYGWELYWAAEAILNSPALVPAAAGRDALAGGLPDPHLHTTTAVGGMHLQATDGRIGHIADLLADDMSWVIRYLVIATSDWLPGRAVLIAPQWVESIDWREATAYVSHSRANVKNSPPFDPASPINRRYEEQLHDYYRRPTPQPP